jgi:hypothetical protein
MGEFFIGELKYNPKVRKMITTAKRILFRSAATIIYYVMSFLFKCVYKAVIENPCSNRRNKYLAGPCQLVSLGNALSSHINGPYLMPNPSLSESETDEGILSPRETSTANSSLLS